MNASEVTRRAQDLRAAQLTPVTSHPRSLALLIACPPAAVPWAYAAAETAVRHGRPVEEVLRNLLDYLSDHPMPTTAVEWACLTSTL